jgi:DNA processing protein
VTPRACPDCLRRARLLGLLAPYIEKIATAKGGTRSPQLLGLPQRELVKRVAPRDGERLLADVAKIPERRLREEIEEAGCWAVCRHDPSYPRGLTDGAEPPAALICRGDPAHLGALDPAASVTLVGARRCSAYGREIAIDLGRELAASGLTVISGMAQGIDGAVHAGALRGGLTVAVLGCAAERPYPARHRALYGQICRQGLVVSELPPGTSPWRWAFPARNRLMAAMAAMTVVVEAALGSGSLITAELAQEAGRTVGAVPGQVTSPVAAGTNELLHSGAHVIRGAVDVLDCLLGPGAAVPPAPGPELEDGLAAMLAACEDHGPSADTVAGALAISAAEAAAGLARLELLGYLRASAVGTYVRTPLQPSAGREVAKRLI